MVLSAAWLVLLACTSFASAAEPRLVANSLNLARGDSVTLSVSHLDAVDADTPPAALTYTVVDPSHGQFEKAAAPGVALTTFSAAEVSARSIRFVHDGSTNAPSYSIGVADETTSSAAIPASVSFTPDPNLPAPPSMASALALVDPAAATHTAIASGHWSDPDVWGGQPPTTGARLVIPAGISVTVDGIYDHEMETLRIDGTLRFAPHIDTRLEVDTIVSTGGARLEIGTSTIPVEATVRAEVVFADDGSIDTNVDFAQIGRGAILHGTTVIHGDATTGHVAMNPHPGAGDTVIELVLEPVGWDVGDEIIVTGTTPNDPESDEIRTITSISGTTVTLDQALQRDHRAPRPDLNVYVANTTRNVIFSSENVAVLRRGHVMFAQTNKVDVNYARFYQLGRTDKTKSLDDFDFDFFDTPNNNGGAPVDFEAIPGNRTNIRGRYPVHIHRNGVDPASAPALVNGCVVFDGPGWGYATHSSHAVFSNNVSYAVQGTGFYTEAGDEIGSMIGNIAIRSVNSAFQFDSTGGAIDPDLGHENQEFGNDGEGFWLSGHLVSMIDNVSAGSTGHGIIVWSDGLVEPDTGRGRTTVQVSHVANGHLIPGRETIPVWWAPLAEFRGNEAYGSTIGFRARYIHSQTYLGLGGSAFHEKPPQAYIDTLEPMLEDLTVWNNRDGVMLNYTERVSLRDVRIVGIGAPFVLDRGTMNAGAGLDQGTEITGGYARVENVSIEGFEMGYVMPRNDQWVIENLHLANVTDLYITEPRLGPRAITMNDITFGPLAGTAVEGRESERRHVHLEPDISPDRYQPYWFVMPDRITIEGQGIYTLEAQADEVPLPQQPPLEDVIVQPPSGYVNKTNAQLQATYGLSWGGAVPPQDAQSVSWVHQGLVGSAMNAPTSLPPLWDMTNEGENPEPSPGGPAPELTRNSIEVTRGQTLVLMETNINTTDTDSGIAERTVNVSNVSGGHFEHRDTPGEPITSFTQADIDGGVVRFVHDGSCAAPSYLASVSDGSTTTAPSAATGTLRTEGDSPCQGPNPTPTPAGTPAPTATPSPPGGPTPTPTASPGPGVTPSPIPSSTPSPTASPQPTHTPTGPLACLPAPQHEDDCKFADRSRLTLLDHPEDDERDMFQWQWIRGEETYADEVGDLSNDSHLQLCVWDFVDLEPTLVMSLRIDGGSAWARSPRGEEVPARVWTMRDKELLQSGIELVKIRLSEFDRVSVKIKGKGPNLLLPAPSTEDEYFLADEEVVVEMWAPSGECWQSRFDDPRVNRGHGYRKAMFKN